MAGLRSEFQLRKVAESEQSDRISLLPTEILVHILSFLKLKEMARTSLVSKHWVELWMFAAVGLDFDGSKVLVGLATRKNEKSFLKKKRCQFVEWVNKVLQLHKAMVIDEFRICFELDKSSQRDIDEWLRFAFARGVQRLQLDLLKYGCPSHEISKPYIFPSCQILNQDSDNISSISEESPTTDVHDKGTRTLAFTDFKSLTSLVLEGVNVTGETLSFFLNKFHFLERLIVSGSSSRDLSSVVVCGSSPPLKYLELTYCRYLKSITVRDSCLVSLKFTRVGDLVLENVPMLVDVWVCGVSVSRVIPLLSCSLLSRLEVLDLYVMGEETFVQVPQLSALKELVLHVCAHEDDSIIHLIHSFMRSSSKSEKFVLELIWVGGFRSEREIEKVFKPSSSSAS
ncbi:OLC1v1011820C1 [Oldenlandia corymbosa var. corymbosa]|uniref:OLC1v1011820C1 n=1 Tax=Oldenlandia corymbosa var. corymbosa TaxID=529605 RepID=A0AAV1DXR1_OLDCO|nr:OLC1v1011820C1 [Oldenlandia corymbosa var. corymbosa]